MVRQAWLRKAFNVTTKTFDNFVGHKFSARPRTVLKERELLFPIPTAEIRNKISAESGY